MSSWFCSSRPTVASVSGDPVVRLMIASRVQVTWSSHSFRMSWWSAASFAVRSPAATAWCGSLPWAMASWPFETASAASALKNATSATRKSGIGRVVRVVSMSDSFRLRCDQGGGSVAPEEAPGGDDADHLECLRDEREALDRLRLRVQERQARRDREGVGDEQARER